MPQLIRCRTCGKEFDPSFKRKIRGGYFNECIECSSEDRKTMYVGRPGATHKGSNIEIFRENLETVRTQIKRESAVGFTANLGLSSQVAVQKWEDKKDN